METGVFTHGRVSTRPEKNLFDHQKTLTIKFLFFFFARVEILPKKKRFFLRGVETLTQGKTH